MATIRVNEKNLEQVYTELNTSSASLDSVKHALPDRTSSSEAMDIFGESTKASKELFTEYRTLFANDIQTFKTTYLALVEHEKNMADGLKK